MDTIVEWWEQVGSPMRCPICGGPASWGTFLHGLENVPGCEDGYCAAHDLLRALEDETARNEFFAYVRMLHPLPQSISDPRVRVRQAALAALA